MCSKCRKKSHGHFVAASTNFTPPARRISSTVFLPPEYYYQDLTLLNLSGIAPRNFQTAGGDGAPTATTALGGRELSGPAVGAGAQGVGIQEGLHSPRLSYQAPNVPGVNGEGWLGPNEVHV